MKRIALSFGAVLLFITVVFSTLMLTWHLPGKAGAVGNASWPTFMGDITRSGANLNESSITAANAQSLKLAWKFPTGGYVVASPAIVNGVMYIGSWDGNEYAINLSTHQQMWKAPLGITHQNKVCYDPKGVGVSSSAAVQNNVVYVGGGDGYMYALNASTGSVIWRTLLGAPPYYNFASPLLYNNKLYIGLSAFCDPPYVQGKLLALNLSNGSVAASISLVPAGQTGAPVWGSAAVDAHTNTIYITTGNPGSQPLTKQPNAEAILALDANTLLVKDRWQIPAADQVNDSDFGVAPTLFDVNGVSYIGALNKNGVYYVLNRSNLHAGPVWRQALGGTPLKQGDNVSSSCYRNGVLYTGSGAIRGTTYGGSVHAFAAATGKQLWFAPTGSMQASVTCTNDLVVDAQSNYVEVRNAASGQLLFRYGTGNRIQSTPLILNGVLYAASRDGSIYAFTPTA